jgi:hypothetical protein
MFPRLRRCALALVLFSVPALASAPPREDRRAARIRTARSTPAPEPEPAEVQPAEAAPIAVAAADAGGIELAGFLGMLTALSASFVYARGRRLSGASTRLRPPPGLGPLDPP